MSLIKCPECGRRISDEAEACIHCGYPIKVKATRNKNPNADALIPASAASGDDSLVTVDSRALQKSGVPAAKPLSQTKTILFITGAALLLILAALSFYLLYYRPHFVPHTVENAKYTIQCNGSTYQCSFTGTMLNRKPQGTGRFVSNGENSDTVFEGELTDGTNFSAGEVSNLPVLIETYAGEFEAFYSGEIAKGKPIDTYQVSAMPLSVEFDGKVYNGFYTGEIKQDTPNGTGSFSSENKDKYFEYTGSWQDGKLIGEGQLSSNDIVAHLPEVDRAGTYDGAVVDGVFCGKGKFSAVNDDEESYAYEGDWEDGSMEGQGRLIFPNVDTYPKYIGTFKDGEFQPTILEFLTAYGTYKDEGYSISSKAQNFIETHEELFTNNSTEGILNYVDKDFTYREFSKNPNKFGDNLFKITSFLVFQAFENEDYWGRKVTSFLGYDGNYNVYYGILFGYSDKIAEDKRITLYALPLAFSTYKGANNNQIWAVRFVAVGVE